MRTRYWLAVAALFVVLLVLGIAGIVSGQAFQAGSHIDVSSSRTIDSSVYVAGRNVTVAATVNGDVFCAGQDVHITGTVHGDVLCAAQTLSVSGTVDGNVRLAGQTVTLSGKTGGNASVAAQTFSLEDRAGVGKDLSLTVNDVDVRGAVGRDIALASSTATIAGHIGRDVTGRVESLALNDGALIGGNLTYTSNNTLTTSGSARVAGKTIHRFPPQQEARRNLFAIGAVASLLTFLMALVLAFVVALFFPQSLRDGAAIIMHRPLPTLGVGALIVFVAPIVAIILLVTVLGLPLAFIVGLLWLVALVLSLPYFAYFVGRAILGQRANLFVNLALGVVILMLVSLIPFVGVLVWLVTTLFGAGALGLLLVQHYRRPVYAGV